MQPETGVFNLNLEVGSCTIHIYVELAAECTQPSSNRCERFNQPRDPISTAEQDLNFTPAAKE